MGGSSSGKGGQSKSEQTQSSAPPSWAKPLFTTGATDALAAYNSGKGGNVYKGNRVADLSNQTQGAISGLQNAANNYNNSYLNGLATNPTSSSSNLSDMAAGKMIGNNAQFNEALQNTLNNTANTINSQMSGAGRYGSGAHSGVMSDKLGQAATSALSQQYNQDVANMMNANNMVDQSNINQLNSANSYYQGQSNAQRNALAGGSVIDQNNQNKLNADWQKWSEEDNRDWKRINLLLGAAQGSAGNYGTTTGTTTQTQGGNPLQSIGGAVSTGLGLFGKSDIRAKSNVKHVGERNGFPVYEFTYKGKKTRYRGVMAQDVLNIMPSAVSIDPTDGLYMVDYSQIGFPMEVVGVKVD
ncbi:tail fiber domain-containing protein [Bartonella tamiae]|uniref:tail fiber domain-containing protein n=1 Tax=Bartonella tamiae TaxID=373638 RepID=UPI00026E77A7|nr:tail fiber domain-containing protein [Bartonella tamiae]EJF92646.1 hypothetical protein MEG_01816 [Bartonella tamiae Th307]